MKFDARRILLFVLVLASLAYHGARVYLSANSLINPGLYPASPFELKAGSNEVQTRNDAAAAAGLEVGDQIVRVQDHDLRGHGDLATAIVAAAPTGRLQVEVRRPTGPVVLDLPLPRPLTTPDLSDIASALALEIALPLFFLGVGFTVVWFKPESTVAWLLL